MPNSEPVAAPPTSTGTKKIRTKKSRPEDSPGLSWLGIVPLIFGVLFFALIVWTPQLAGAKAASLEVLDTEFGAALFLAGALSFIASAASQYWRFLDARRQYYIVSNREQAEEMARTERMRAEARVRAERQKAEQDAREYRAKERMLENYQRHRSAIQNYSFAMYAAQRTVGLSSRNEGLQQLADVLVQVAIGPDRTIYTITQADVDRLTIFRNYSVSKQLDLFAKAVLMKTPEMDSTTAAKITDLFLPPNDRTSEQAKVLISELLSELGDLQNRLTA